MFPFKSARFSKISANLGYLTNAVWSFSVPNEPFQFSFRRRPINLFASKWNVSTPSGTFGFRTLSVHLAQNRSFGPNAIRLKSFLSERFPIETFDLRSFRILSEPFSIQILMVWFTLTSVWYGYILRSGKTYQMTKRFSTHHKPQATTLEDRFQTNISPFWT